MSSKSETTKRRDGKAPADPPAPAPTNSSKKKTKKKVRMTQEQIDSYIRYQTVYMPEEALPRISEETLALAKDKDLSHLSVPLDQVDDYIASILRDINREEAKFMKEREKILNDYYTKGYTEEEVTDGEGEGGSGAVAPPTGRRSCRFRPGVAKKAG